MSYLSDVPFPTSTKVWVEVELVIVIRSNVRMYQPNKLKVYPWIHTGSDVTALNILKEWHLARSRLFNFAPLGFLFFCKKLISINYL